MSHMNHLNHLKIPFQEIKNCTQDFNQSNFIGKGGYGKVYKGILSWPADHENRQVAVKRLDVSGGQGSKEFYTEITMFSQLRHDNIIALIGFCDDSEEMILVYEYASHGSLDTYLNGASELSWQQLLQICIDVASALDYLHNHVAAHHRIIHRDIKSANILLDENWNAKLSDFGLSKIGLANQENSFLITNVAGTYGYCDPEYHRTGVLTKESDVYSFGVVLFEVLCGRMVCVTSYHDERRFLHYLARTHYKNGELDKIIDPKIKKHIKPRTLRKFSAIAYQCLQEAREERPTIAKVALELKKAKEFQWDSNLSPMDAAALIQKYFRSFMMRYPELSDARHQIRKLESLFNDDAYRNRITNDKQERKRYLNNTTTMIYRVNILKVSNDYERASYWSMKRTLGAINDVLNANEYMKQLVTLFNDHTYRSRIANHKHERERYKDRVSTLISKIDNNKGGSNVNVGALQRSIKDKLQALLDALDRVDPQPSKTT